MCPDIKEVECLKKDANSLEEFKSILERKNIELNCQYDKKDFKTLLSIHVMCGYLNSDNTNVSVKQENYTFSDFS